MNEASQKSVSYKQKHINFVKKQQSRRTKPKDVFQVITDMKGKEALNRVLNELTRLHVQHYGGKQHVKLMSVEQSKAPKTSSTQRLDIV